MDMTTATESTSREEVLEAMAEVMERQARVARAEAALGAARRRLDDSLARLARLSSLARARGESPDLPPLAGVTLKLDERSSTRSTSSTSSTPAADTDEDDRHGTLRERILAVVAASPAQVYTPALLASAVGSQNRDSVRNTLLVLAAKGKIQKVGTGQYQARPPDMKGEPAAPPST
jgi:hypothetical protein